MVCVRSSLVRLIDRGVAEITGCEANPKGMDIIFIKNTWNYHAIFFLGTAAKIQLQQEIQRKVVSLGR